MAFTENFNIPDENPLSNGGRWDTHSAFGPAQMRVVSDRCAPAAETTWSGRRFVAGVPAADQYAQVELAVDQANTSAAVVVRSDDVGTGYLVLFSDSQNNPTVGAGAVYRLTGQTWTQIGSVFYPTAGISNYNGPGQTMRAEAEGSTIRGLVNGALQATRTDATYATGNAGVAGYAAAATGHLDNWEAGDLYPTPGSPHYAYAQQ